MLVKGCIGSTSSIEQKSLWIQIYENRMVVTDSINTAHKKPKSSRQVKSSRGALWREQRDRIFREFDNIDRPHSRLIGPHDGQELELMLAGEKPLAYFYAFLNEPHLIPTEAFEPYVRQGLFRKYENVFPARSHELPAASYRIVLYALADEEGRLSEAREILEPFWMGKKKHTLEDDVQLGRLLGYREEVINYFLSFQLEA